MSNLKLRLDPADEYMHPLEKAENFNESMYFNTFDPESRLGGFFRVGNRPNEGHAEMTCCLYLPDGRVGFMFQRPELRTNDAFDAAGMRFDVLEPFKRLRVRYEGGAVLLDDPLQMANPKEAFAKNPIARIKADLEFTGVSPMYGGEPVEARLDESQANPFARGHYEQHMQARGALSIGEQTWDLNGFGLRDHSWGPRYWQAPWWYRWLTGCFEPGFGFMVNVIAQRDGKLRIGGMILEEGHYDPILEAKIESEWADRQGQLYHRSLVARVRTQAGKTHELRGEPLAQIPLRNRRKAPDGELLVTRITETMMRYALNGRTGYGIAEYLDQMQGDRPVGVEGERSA